MECAIENLVDALVEASRAYVAILADYYKLSLRSELSENDVNRLSDIYNNAEQDPLLNFFINEADRILGQRLGLLDEECLNDYKDQQAWLREHLEQTLLERNHRIEAQTLLQERGFYVGPIDGVWGDRSVEAVTQYRIKVQELLQEKGLYQGRIDGELGNHSITAVQQFQQLYNLKQDGVPGRQTFSVLQWEVHYGI